MRKKNKKRKKFFYINLWQVFFVLIIIFFYIVLSIKFNIYINNKLYKKDITLGKFLLLKELILEEILKKEKNIIKTKIYYDIKNKSVNIKTIEENPVAAICYKNECYILGEHSYIFKPTKYYNISHLLKIKSSLPIKENTILNPKLTNALALIFEYSHNKSIFLKQIEILSNYDLIIQTKQFRFIVDPNKDVKNQLKKLEYFINNYKEEYHQIDLRIDKKIYFK
jgi:hypothetical protein